LSKKISIIRKLLPVLVVLALLPFGNNKYVKAETYQLDFGPLIEAIPGEQGLLIPMDILVTQPVVGINILLIYDPTLITPDIIAPNIFFQSFDVDMSIPGRIKLNLLTNLPPPPVIPPLLGDTTYAWISVTVTSEHIGYDLITHINFWEDPVTPYPDNNIWLEEGGWVVPPGLVLNQADILIINPIYGDININGYPYEIGDAITFMNYFMGEVEFNKRQYANSDCNQDGIQATISDLVFLLGVISGDTLFLSNPPYSDTQNSLAGSDKIDIANSNGNFTVCDIEVNSDQDLGGAYFVLEYDSDISEPVSVFLNPQYENMELSWTIKDDEVMIAIFDWQGGGISFPDGEMVSIIFSGDSEYLSNTIKLAHVDFSDEFGNAIDGNVTLKFNESGHSNIPRAIGISLEGYPNPFNNSMTINYNLPVDGNYDLVIFDLLGREVKTLFVGNQSSGAGTVYWNGVDNYGQEIASGLYFARLRGEQVSASLKLIMMK
jgi:hypothetical protein